tara:strand:+ start:25 stop:429 length:405 start_codon:yes stop_codon:yes gene_type:complete
MPFVKPFTAGENSEVAYKAEIKPIIHNTPLSPIELANEKIAQLHKEQIAILNEEQGVVSQKAGGTQVVKKYKIYDDKYNIGVIKACCSSKAALFVFHTLRKKHIRKRTLVIINLKTKRKYKYTFSKGQLKRIYL